MKSEKKIVFLFPTNRQRILETVRDGKSPDNELYGLNYFESLGWQTSFVDVSSTWQNFLDKVFFLLGRLFRQQIDITFQLGRALLMVSAINKADVVLTNTDSIGLPICFLKRLGIIKPPVIYAVGLFYIQGKLKEAVDNGRQTLFRRFYVWILAVADHIIYHSPIEKEKLVKLSLYNPAYCTFVPIGSDGNFFRNIKRSDLAVRKGRTLKDTPLVLAVGRDHARDYKTLFEAAEKLPEYNFVVICSQRNIDGLKVPNNVKVLLDLPYREVAEWHQKANVVVIPMKEMHRSSGQMTLTDAIQAGKAIVASDVLGIGHYRLKNSQDALLVAPDDSGLLKQAISRVVSDDNLRRRLEKQTEKLARRFTTGNYAKHIAEAVDWATDRIKLRPLESRDLKFVRRLRNDNRQYFFDDSYISRQNHLKWFEAHRKKTDDFMFILEDGGVRVGVGGIYHIDRLKRSAEIGRFVIENKFRHRGLGGELIKKIERISAREMNLNRLVLEVLQKNDSAINVYKKIGYTRYGVRKAAGRIIIKMEKVLQSAHDKKKGIAGVSAGDGAGGD